MNHAEPDGGHEEHDLTPVLSKLTAQRGTSEAQHRLANDPATRLFLRAGVSILSEDPMHMTAITTPRIVREAKKVAADLPNNPMPSPAKFRDRWPFMDLYRADLFSYCRWLRTLSLSPDTELNDQLSAATGFYDTIQRIAFRDLESVLRDEFNKIPFLIALSPGNDQVAKDSVHQTNEDIRRVWEGLCTEVLARRGLRLRPGTTVQEVADLLISLSDGIALHALSQETSALIDRDRHESLFGTGAAALIVGFLDPGDGQSLQAALDGLTGDGDRAETSRAG